MKREESREQNFRNAVCREWVKEKEPLKVEGMTIKAGERLGQCDVMKVKCRQCFKIVWLGELNSWEDQVR